jgi:hypothetical protein
MDLLQETLNSKVLSTTHSSSSHSNLCTTVRCHHLQCSCIQRTRSKISLGKRSFKTRLLMGRDLPRLTTCRRGASRNKAYKSLPRSLRMSSTKGSKLKLKSLWKCPMISLSPTCSSATMRKLGSTCLFRSRSSSKRCKLTVSNNSSRSKRWWSRCRSHSNGHSEIFRRRSTKFKRKLTRTTEKKWTTHKTCLTAWRWHLTTRRLGMI